MVEGAEIHMNMKEKMNLLIVYSTQICNFEPLRKDKALININTNTNITLYDKKNEFSWCFLPSHLHTFTPLDILYC